MPEEHRTIVKALTNWGNNSNRPKKIKANLSLMPDDNLFNPKPFFVPAITRRGKPKFGGSVPNYVFTTVDGLTGYYADDANGRTDRTRNAQIFRPHLGNPYLTAFIGHKHLQRKMR